MISSQATSRWQDVGIAEGASSRVTCPGIKDWIRHNTDRDNFYVDSNEAIILAELERYIKGRLGPIFEGGQLRIHSSTFCAQTDALCGSQLSLHKYSECDMVGGTGR